MLLFLVILISSFLLTFVVKYYAEKKSILDIPNQRSSHITPTARGGGMAIALTWFAGITYLFFTENIEANLYYALMAGLLISAISFMDDIYNLKYLIRFAIQAIATIIALFFLGGLNKIDLGFYVFENSFLLNIFAFFGILWFVNLFNFIDGIDGYAGSEAIFVSLALMFFLRDTFLLLLAAAVLGFVPWNWAKAKIFMGDIGSTLLGFTLVVFAIYYQNNNEFSILNWLILTSVFWVDATLTLYRRFRNKESLSHAHKKHAYQRIVQAGFSHQKTVVFSILINLFLFALAYFSSVFSKFILMFFVADVLVLFIIVRMIDRKKGFT